MRKTLFVPFTLILILMVQLANAQATAPSPEFSVPTSFYGLHVNRGGGVINGTEPWPGTGASTQTFSSLRTLNFTDGNPPGCVHWRCMNPANGTYVFETNPTTDCSSPQNTLDNAICHAKQYGQDVLYTPTGTPTWAQTNCGYKFACPPVGLGNDGSGSDADYQNYVTALASYIVKTHGTGVVRYWETWNEINFHNPDGQGWAGSSAQLVRMACDANVIVKNYDSGAMIVSPPASDGSTDKIQLFLTTRIPAGYGPNTCSGTGCTGAECVDVIGTHGYVDGSSNGYGCPTVGTGVCPVPEDAQIVLNNIRNLMSSLGIDKPLFITEDGWGAGELAPVAVEHASWISRVMLMFAMGTGTVAPPDRLYVYGFDFAGTTGQGPDDFQGSTSLWDYWDSTEQPTSAGIAYSQIQTWLAGKVISSCGPVNGTQSMWACDLNLQSGTGPERIVWDASMTRFANRPSCFEGGLCPSSPYTFYNTSYTKYYTLLGGSTSNPLTRGTMVTVPLSAEAILLSP